MKYIKLFFILSILLLLFGCNPSIPKTEKGKELLPTIPNSFSLYVVDDKVSVPRLDELKQLGIQTVTKINSTYALEDAKEEYPFLELKKAPTYIVFNQKKIVYQTNERQKLIEFLQKH